MKNKFAFILDLIFALVITFILALVAFNFFIPYPYSIIYSALLALLSLLLCYANLSKQRARQKLNSEEQKEKRKLMSELNFSQPHEQTALIERALINAKLTYQKKKGGILIKDSLILCRFSFNNVSKADLIKAFNLIDNSQEVYILAERFDGEIYSFAERFNGKILLVDGDEVFKYLKEKNALPESYKYEIFAEKKKKASLKNLLDKKKAKTFLLFGATFLLFSYISPLKAYYIICGCLFLIYSLVLRLFGKQINLNEFQTDKK